MVRHTLRTGVLADVPMAVFVAGGAGGAGGGGGGEVVAMHSHLPSTTIHGVTETSPAHCAAPSPAAYVAWRGMPQLHPWQDGVVKVASTMLLGGLLLLPLAA